MAAELIVRILSSSDALADGTISASKLTGLFRQLGVSLSHDDVEKLLASGGFSTTSLATKDVPSFIDMLFATDENSSPIEGGILGESAVNISRTDMFDVKQLDLTFEVTCKQMMSTLRADFEKQLRVQRNALRHQYNTSLRGIQKKCMQRCADIALEFQVASSNEGCGCGVVHEVLNLQNSLSDILDRKRESLDGDRNILFDSITSDSLQAILQDSKKLQQYAENCMSRLTVSLDLAALDGTSFPVEVRPAVQTVASVLKQVRELYGLRARALVQENGMISMRNPDLMVNYDLTSNIQLVLESEPVDSPLVRIPFDNPAEPGYDTVSGLVGEVLDSEHNGLEPWNVDGREGVNFKGRTTLKLPSPVKLDDAWTVSVWTHAPYDPSKKQHGYKVLLDGERTESMILLTLYNKKIGYYARGGSRYCDLQDDSSSSSSSRSDSEDEEASENSRKRKSEAKRSVDLTCGWHHLAAVGENKTVTYYVDGCVVGTVPCKMMSGSVVYVGNTARGMNNEAFGVVSDFRLFGSAATAEQIQVLAEVA
eukprot:TRINITY_DN5360_c0_g1_i1.p1 TRINITY_DN5360_c0_g1~~TRINITY_DN5360_c0_g1_i1.p1  ORF type:complete len:561 (+),score=48.95 TRINITY_DN5360_c0_g1_i1:67-1683(+)